MILIRNRGDANLSFPANSKVLPGGEVHPSVNPDVASWKAVTLVAHLQNAVDVMDLLVVTDAIRRLNPAVDLHLQMPYVPYARQDRVPNLGESLTIKVFCDLINAQKYSTVSVLDVHSDVGVALLDRVRHVTLAQAVATVMRKRDWANTILVSPDAGAMKKTLDLAKLVGCPKVVCAFKDRDTATGKITSTRVDLDFTPEAGKSWLVVDDICDGGYTFVELAKALEAKLEPYFGADFKLDLWVTHGLFTKGYQDLCWHYDSIETTNSWNFNGLYNQRPDGVNDNKIYWHPVQGIM